MKKIAFLPLLLVVPMITGCGSVKSPKFSKLDKVEYAKWVEAFQKAANSSAYAKADKVGDFKLTVESKDSSEQVILRGAKKTYKGKEFTAEKESVKYDKDSLILSFEKQYKQAGSYGDQHGKVKTNGNNKEKSDFQQAQYKGANYIVEVDLEDKSYKPEALLSDSVKAEDQLDSLAKNTVKQQAYAMTSLLTDYNYSSTEEKAKYSFYATGNVYAIEYKSEVTNKEYKVADEVIYKYTKSTTEKCEVDFTEGKLSVKYYAVEQEVRTYVKSYDKYAEGTILSKESKESKVATAVSKDQKLKAANIEKFAPIGF